MTNSLPTLPETSGHGVGLASALWSPDTNTRAGSCLAVGLFTSSLCVVGLIVLMLG